jgi:hypothetical protein
VQPYMLMNFDSLTFLPRVTLFPSATNSFIAG